MSTSTEELIRRALERQAELAAPPERIRGALPARISRRARRRRYAAGATVALAAAAVAAVLAVPWVALDNSERGRIEPAGPGPEATRSAGPTPGAMTIAAAPLRYRPTWVPPGVTERSRRASLGMEQPSVIQIWKKRDAPADFDEGGSGLRLTVAPAESKIDPASENGTAVEVNGRPGSYVAPVRGDDKSYLHWIPEPGTEVTIQQIDLGLTKQDLLTMARSVRPDPAVLPVPLQAGWLPDGVTADSVDLIGASPAAWQLSVSARVREGAPAATPVGKEAKESGDDPVSVTLSIGAGTARPEGGEAITVGGRPGRFLTRHPVAGRPYAHQHVVVELDAGRLLTVWCTGPLTRADAIRIAERVEVGAPPDVSWLGR